MVQIIQNRNLKEHAQKRMFNCHQLLIIKNKKNHNKKLFRMIFRMNHKKKTFRMIFRIMIFKKKFKKKIFKKMKI